jgi:hypothetical protein
MHDSERAIPRVEVVEVDCPGGMASGFQKRDGNERYAADLAKSVLALARSETTKSGHSQSFTQEKY